MLLKNAKIFRGEALCQYDVRLSGDRISEIGEGLKPLDGEEMLDLEGKVLHTGLIDVHVHWREPGFSHKETIETASKAAARGGYTLVMPMPNLKPCPDSVEGLKVQLDLIKEHSVIRALPYGAITVNEAGEVMADLEGMADQVFAFTDDGRGVQEANMMYEAMCIASKLNKAVVAHCEDNSLIRGGVMHEGKRSAELGLPGIPSICESVQVARDILLAEAANCHYHVCHISAEGSIRAVQDAKRHGLKVTCEVTPHHLLSCDEDIPGDEGMWKMNPPLRGKKDQELLLKALLDGSIDLIATDQAPHTLDEKQQSMRKAPFGIVGIETAFSQLYTALVKTGQLSLKRLLDLMSQKPAEVFGLPYGKLEVGEVADLVVIDLERESVIEPETFQSLGKNTPYAGQKVCGIPVMTLVAGKVVYKAE